MHTHPEEEGMKPCLHLDSFNEANELCELLKELLEARRTGQPAILYRADPTKKEVDPME